MINTIQKRSAGGIVHINGKFLVIKVIPEDEIVFPKGTIEDGETPERTAVREIFEETGYKTKIKTFLEEISYDFDKEDGKHYRKTVYYYLLESFNKDAAPTPHREEYENFENLWLSANEAFEQLTHNNSKEMLKKALSKL